MMYAESLFRNAYLFILFPLLTLPLLTSEAHASENIGYLWVASQPKYALVYLDGKYVATTPILKLLDVEPGQHKIELSNQGYKLYQEKIIIRRGQALEIDIVLAGLDSETSAKSTKRYVEAYITIRSEPSDADVYLDDEPIGKTSVLDYKVQPGEPKDRKLRIAKPGYKPHEETMEWIDIRDKIKIRGSVKLELLKKAVSTKPPVKPRRDRKFLVNTHVIILFIMLLVIMAILTTRIIIRRRQRGGDD